MRSDTGASAGGRPPARRPYRRPSPLDRLVLQTLREAGRPLSAYAITRRSVASGAPLSPTQAYRVLDRLVARGEVQRIALLAAYLPARADRPGVLVCRRCRAVTAVTVAALAPAIEQLCRRFGFAAPHAHVELSGLCERCRRGRHAGRSSGLLALLVILAASPADAAAAPGTDRSRQSVRGSTATASIAARMADKARPGITRRATSASSGRYRADPPLSVGYRRCSGTVQTLPGSAAIAAPGRTGAIIPSCSPRVHHCQPPPT